MSLTVTDLRTRRAETWEKAKAFLDERRDTESGCLSAEDVFFNDPAAAEIYALALHGALPICPPARCHGTCRCGAAGRLLHDPHL